jgi:phospholipase DDHD1
VRSVINETCLDVLYYRSPYYGQRLINAVAHLLNSKVALYKQRFPKFSGHVSLFCHSLGSVIMFDLLQKQRQPGDAADTCRPTVMYGTGEPRARGIGTHSDEDWVWPQLKFKVHHLFGLGSPISIFLTTRGDIYKDTWPLNATSFAFPCGARFFNIFDPTDPVAFRFRVEGLGSMI